MERSTQELALHKLYILYILQKMDIPLTNAQITNIFMENDLLDYFSLQQYFHELTEAGLIGAFDKGGLSHYMISEKGSVALEYFKSRIPAQEMDNMEIYLAEKRENILHQREISTSTRQDKNGDYEVDLKILDYDTPHIHIFLKVPTARTARIICDNWKENASESYSTIVELLMNSGKEKDKKQ